MSRRFRLFFKYISHSWLERWPNENEISQRRRENALNPKRRWESLLLLLMLKTTTTNLQKMIHCNMNVDDHYKNMLWAGDLILVTRRELSMLLLLLMTTEKGRDGEMISSCEVEVRTYHGPSPVPMSTTGQQAPSHWQSWSNTRLAQPFRQDSIQRRSYFVFERGEN